MRVRASYVLIYYFLGANPVAGDADDLVIPGEQYPGTEQVSKDEMAGFITAFGSVCGLVGISIWRGRGIDVTVWIENLVLTPLERLSKRWQKHKSLALDLQQKIPLNPVQSERISNLFAYHRSSIPIGPRVQFKGVLSTIEEDTGSAHTDISLVDSPCDQSNSNCASEDMRPLDSPFGIIPNYSHLTIRVMDKKSMSKDSVCETAASTQVLLDTVDRDSTSSRSNDTLDFCFETPLRQSSHRSNEARHQGDGILDWRLWCRLVEDNDPPGVECAFLV